MGNMKVEIRAHYWPNTPEFREIKLRVDDNTIYSKFLSVEDIWDLAKQFRGLEHQLMDIGNEMHDANLLI